MKHNRALHALLLAGTLLAGAAAAAEKQTIRPELAKPLQDAQKALQAKQYPQAQAALAAADKVGKFTAYEGYVINRMRASAAVGTGDYKTAVASYQQLLASPALPPEEKLSTLDAYVKLNYAAKDYAKTADAIRQYKAAGGNSADTLGLYTQSLYLSGRYAEAATQLKADIAAQEAAGKRPSDTQLQLLASCALKQNDMNAYVAALERLVTYSPKQDYWLDLIVRTAGKPGFSTRLDLDVYRLRRSTGTLERPGDYIDAAQLALQAGFPGEAQAFIDEGYQKKLLGTGDDAARHQRLKELVAKKAEEDKRTLAEGEKAAAAMPSGDALISTGYNLVAYGQPDKGLPLMEQGMKKGGLKSEDRSRLQLGYAYFKSGRKAEASKAFGGVKGADGSKDVARLWTLAMKTAK